MGVTVGSAPPWVPAGLRGCVRSKIIIKSNINLYTKTCAFQGNKTSSTHSNCRMPLQTILKRLRGRSFCFVPPRVPIQSRRWLWATTTTVCNSKLKVSRNKHVRALISACLLNGTASRFVWRGDNYHHWLA